MADSLSGYLSKLHSLLSSDAPQRDVKASNIVLDLSTFCLQNVKDAELGELLPLLLGRQVHGEQHHTQSSVRQRLNTALHMFL